MARATGWARGGGQQWVARVRAAVVDPTVGSSVVGLSEKDPSGGVDPTPPPPLPHRSLRRRLRATSRVRVLGFMIFFRYVLFVVGRIVHM